MSTLESTKSELERRRAAAERAKGLLADLAPGRSLADELIAERRRDARVERASADVRRRRGAR
jgi:hypothetical protein